MKTFFGVWFYVMFFLCPAISNLLFTFFFVYVLDHPSLGTAWTNGLPEDEYEVHIVTSGEEQSTGWQPLSEADNRLKELLVWLHQFHVMKVPGDAVVCYEQTVFFVKTSSLKPASTWGAVVDLFSVWEQEDWTVQFQLAKRH